jgi:hypothetical protein
MTGRIIGALRQFGTFLQSNKDYFLGNSYMVRHADRNQSIVCEETPMQNMLIKLEDRALVEMYKNCGVLAENYDLRAKRTMPGFNSDALIPETNIALQHKAYAAIEMTEEEKYMIYAAVLMESSVTGYTEGEMAGIASGILNRVLVTHRGKDTVKGVITDPGQVNGSTKPEYRYAMSHLTGDSSYVLDSDKLTDTDKLLIRKKLEDVKPAVDKVINGTIGFYEYQLLGDGKGPIFFGNRRDFNGSTPIFREAREGKRGDVFWHAGNCFFR